MLKETSVKNVRKLQIINALFIVENHSDKPYRMIHAMQQKTSDVTKFNGNKSAVIRSYGYTYTLK